MCSSAAIGSPCLEKCFLVRFFSFFSLKHLSYILPLVIIDDMDFSIFSVMSWFNFFMCFLPLYFLLRAVDHQWNGDLFATAGAQVDIWNHNRFD